MTDVVARLEARLEAQHNILCEVITMLCAEDNDRAALLQAMFERDALECSHPDAAAYMRSTAAWLGRAVALIE